MQTFDKNNLAKNMLVIERIGRKLETGNDLVGRWPMMGVASASASLKSQPSELEDVSEVVLQRKSM